jgi:multidrug efflux pump subunit AcrB
MTKSYDPVIADAKRRARRHAKESGTSYQASLDIVAKTVGRDDWNHLVRDPAKMTVDPSVFHRISDAIRRNMKMDEKFMWGLITALMVPLTWMIAQYIDWVPEPPIWMVAIAFALVAAFVTTFLVDVACRTIVFVGTFISSAKTGIVEVGMIRNVMFLTSAILWMFGMVLLLLIPHMEIPGLMLAAGSWIPMIMSRLLFGKIRGDRTKRQLNQKR